jgi:RHH-type proline utilization regulon transcriptional repressor/proline dehydrogenase/delta 1-pyrroline-5-carboxylate dehydrogenase
MDAVLEVGSSALRPARHEGPVVSVERLAPGDPAVPLERLVVERSVSINTAAAGGNASLMTMA